MPSSCAGIISQARMTSTRLPGKVLMKIGGKTLLEYHIERLRWSGLPLVVATTVNQADDPIVEACDQLGIPTFRGDENDVLSRYHEAIDKFGFDPIVRVTSDCPLIDGWMIGEAVKKYTEAKTPWLYASNCLERTYPRGFDFEIFSRDMIDEAFQKAHSTPEREHVTPYLHQNLHGKTQFLSLTRSPDLSGFRLTVDEPDDFKMIERLILGFACAGKPENEITEILLQNPELRKINSHIEQKKV